MPRLLALVLAGGALLLGACGGGVQKEGAGATAPAAAPAEMASQPRPGVPTVLDFSASAIGGGDIHGAHYAGRPVVLWFWSPW